MRLCLLVLFIACSSDLYANIKLPALVGDRMVLQRNTPLKIWGWANKNERVTVTFLNQTKQTVTDKDGRWFIELPAQPEGGPYTMTLKGNNTITLKDILVGDVWVCGGQSNMGWKLAWSVNNHTEEIANANYPLIRLFQVKELLSYQVKEDVITDQGWQLCSPSSVPQFSAVAYFFGRELYQKYKIPIGLISSNSGGTPAEAWMSAQALKKVPAYNEAYLALEKLSEAELQKRFEKQLREWSDKTIKDDQGYGSVKWYEGNLDTKGWQVMKLPTFWEGTALTDYTGSIWFRKEINIPAEDEGKDATLVLGHPDDVDSTWFNGVKIGGMYGSKLREYKVPGHLVRPGKNTLTTRVVNFGGDGGLGGKPEEMYVQIGDKRIDVSGEWLYKSGDGGKYTAGWPPRPPHENMSELTVLYNAMIAPLKNYKIKGVIFYQGEANVKRASEYHVLFTSLINDWRANWNYQFPFVFAQLSTIMAPPLQPEETQWAELREAQLKTLAVPLTAMAVTIDVGSKDVHGRNKKDVGKRLAIAAQKLAYNEAITHSGPIYKSMQVEGNKIRLTFSHTGSGLQAKDKYGYLRAFAIAGQNKKFVWAKAYIDGNTVVVYNDDIKNPVAARYGWSSNPEDVNLYNKEGLPASPFRTDDH